MNSTERRDMFVEWMGTQWGPKKKLHKTANCKRYAKTLDEITGEAIFKGIEGFPVDIFACETLQEFVSIETKIRSTPGFDGYDKSKEKRLPSAALQKYHDFISWLENTPKDNEVWDCLLAGKLTARETAFGKWLLHEKIPGKNKVYAKSTVEGYVSTLRAASYRGLNFFALDSVEKIEKVVAILDQTKDYQELSEKDHNKLSSALDAYKRFVASDQEVIVISD